MKMAKSFAPSTNSPKRSSLSPRLLRSSVARSALSWARRLASARRRGRLWQAPAPRRGRWSGRAPRWGARASLPGGGRANRRPRRRAGSRTPPVPGPRRRPRRARRRRAAGRCWPLLEEGIENGLEQEGERHGERGGAVARGPRGARPAQHARLPGQVARDRRDAPPVGNFGLLSSRAGRGSVIRVYGCGCATRAFSPMVGPLAPGRITQTRDFRTSPKERRPARDTRRRSHRDQPRPIFL